MTKFVCVQMAVILAILAAWMGLASEAQAHPKLAETKWKEINGDWVLTFQEGTKAGTTWKGSWSGNLHDKMIHPKGTYVLTMKTDTRGTLTLYDDGKVLCEASVQFEGNDHFFKFGDAEYHRKK